MPFVQPAVDEKISSKKVGRLSFVAYVTDGLIQAACSCGFPCVLVPEDAWAKGKVLGCPVCHVEEYEAREKEASDIARENVAIERERKEQSRQRALYVVPHYEDLTRRQRTYFKTLSQYVSFSTQSMASVFRMPEEDVWSEVFFPLLTANLLVERVGYEQVPRPYTEHGPYSDGASRESTYTVRRVAVAQMEVIEEQEARLHAEREAWEADAPLREAKEREAIRDFAVSEVRDFIAARCTVDPSASESEIVLRAKYVAWAEESKRPTLALGEFGEAFDNAGFTSVKGKRQGLRLKKQE